MSRHQRFIENSLHFGADYNPEQWPREVWLEDISLMLQAGVNLVTLPVFGWANLEISDGVYRFDWLNEILTLLSDAGIGVDLATATASPPAWLLAKYPEVRAVTRDGKVLSHGGRQNYCISSPVYRRKSAELASQLASAFADHPAVKMWHVNNEFGCHNPLCFCEVSSGAFRSWLLAKYSDLQSLNQAWGTDFWSQKYHEWSEISAPKVTPMGTHPNPGMMLDFHRFSNWQILELFKSERNAIRDAGAKQPITTNFMSLKHFGYLDYFQWAEEVDFVSTDHYLISQSPNSHIELAFQADLTRGFARGKPWLLMEHSTSAVNWQSVNCAKVGNQMMRNSLSHVARGSDGAMFFQWRASISGSEKFHSAMVPHAGTSSKLWKNVLQLGSRLAKLNEIKATETEPAEVAMVFDYESWWALSQPNLPSSEISYPDLAHEWYEALWDLGIRVDFVPKDASLDQLSVYKCVLMPMTYVLSDADEEKWLRYKASGCTLVVSYLSGIVDELDRIKLGGYGGRLVREGLGAIVEEFAPLSVETNFELSNGMVGFQWQQWLASSSGETIANFSTGPAEGCAAITKTFDSVPSWYLGTRLGGEALRDFFRLVFTEVPVAKAGGKGVEVIRRGGLEFVIDHNRDTVDWRDIENVGH